MSRIGVFPGHVSPKTNEQTAIAIAESYAWQKFNAPEPVITYFHDGSHESTTTTGGAGICYRDWLPKGSGRMVKLATYLNPVFCSLDAELKAYMLAIQRSDVLVRRHASFLKGKRLTIRHFFDSATMIKWLLNRVQVRKKDPLRAQLHRLAHHAIAITGALSQLATDLDIDLDLWLHWCPRTVAGSVEQHRFADQLAGDAALTGFCYDLEEGNEFTRFTISPVMRLFETTVGHKSDTAASTASIRPMDLIKVAAMGRNQPNVAAGEEFATEYQDLLTHRSRGPPVLGKFRATRNAVLGVSRMKASKHERVTKETKRHPLRERDPNTPASFRSSYPGRQQLRQVHGLTHMKKRLPPWRRRDTDYSAHDKRIVPPPPSSPPPPPPQYPPPGSPSYPAPLPFRVRSSSPARPLVYPPVPHLYHSPRRT